MEVKRSIDQIVKLVKQLQRATLDQTAFIWERPENPTETQLQQLRAAGFARLWSEVKFNFPFFDKRLDLNWEQVLDHTCLAS